MQNISPNITYAEATVTKTGYINIPDVHALKCMTELSNKVIEPLIKQFGDHITISSFYRSQKVNSAVGGAVTSQHTLGQAADITGSGKLTNKMIFDYIKNTLEYDQIIWEFGTDKNPAWVHVSYRINPRKQALRSIKQNGKTRYIQYENAV